MRWMVTRKGMSFEGEELTIIEIYKEGENKEQVKKENRRWTHKRELIKSGKS